MHNRFQVLVVHLVVHIKGVLSGALGLSQGTAIIVAGCIVAFDWMLIKGSEVAASDHPSSGLHGFRRRWCAQAASSDPANDVPTDVTSQDDANLIVDSPDFNNESFLDNIDDAGLEGLDDFENFSDIPQMLEDIDSFSQGPQASEDGNMQQSVQSEASMFWRPTPKSKPQSLVQIDDPCDPKGVKRVADDLASRVVHKRLKDVKQPWQRGPLASLFGKPKQPWQFDDVMHCVGLPDYVSEPSSSSVAPVPPKSTEIGRQRIRASRMINDADDFRRVALSRFKVMILSQLESTKLGTSLQTFAGTLCTNDELSQIFTDVFAPKSSGTVIKRCNAVWRFYHWLQKRGGGSPFSQHEDVLYEYVSQLRLQAGATAPSQFVEAMRFCDGLFNFIQVPIDSSLSPRVVGAAHGSHMSKRIRKPAGLLSLDEIAELERLCIEGAPNHIHLFFSFMSAARWHDTMYIVETEFTEHRGIHLIEASTERHKTSRGKEQQMELLPFTALGQATLDVSWSESWGGARIRAGCLDWHYFLRSWSESSATWSPGRMSTAEGTCWLRELLEPLVGQAGSQKLTVHGLKATLCSWAAKSLMFSPEEQLALGHHVHPQYKSAMIYSRDNQIRLCTKLHFMFRKLREGSFNPDANRVSRLFELTQDLAVQQDIDEASQGSETSSDSDVASSQSEKEVEMEQQVQPRLRSADVSAQSCRIHEDITCYSSFGRRWSQVRMRKTSVIQPS